MRVSPRDMSGIGLDLLGRLGTLVDRLRAKGSGDNEKIRPPQRPTPTCGSNATPLPRKPSPTIPDAVIRNCADCNAPAEGHPGPTSPTHPPPPTPPGNQCPPS